MCRMISCLVDRGGKVYARDGVHSHSAIAELCGINEDKCLKYEFDLVRRELVQDFTSDSAPFGAKQSHDQAAQRFFNACAGDADKLIAFVRRGNWDRDLLPQLLVPSALKLYNETYAPARKLYEETRASALKLYDETYASAWKLYDETCATALKLYDETCAPAWKLYNETCASAWCELFAMAENRIEVWR